MVMLVLFGHIPKDLLMQYVLVRATTKRVSQTLAIREDGWADTQQRAFSYTI